MSRGDRSQNDDVCVRHQCVLVAADIAAAAAIAATLCCWCLLLLGLVPVVFGIVGGVWWGDLDARI